MLIPTYSLVFLLPASTLANIFPTFPVNKSTCTIGQTCQVKWVDSSTPPSASTVGPTSLELVKGSASNLTFVMAIGSVANPGVALALTFTPASNLTQGSDYAIKFTSAQLGAQGVVFSTFFSLLAADSSSNSSAAINGSMEANGSMATNVSAAGVGPVAINGSTAMNGSAVNSTSGCNMTNTTESTLPSPTKSMFGPASTASSVASTPASVTNQTTPTTNQTTSITNQTTSAADRLFATTVCLGGALFAAGAASLL